MFRCSIEFKELLCKVASKYNLTISLVLQIIAIRIRRGSLRTCNTFSKNKMYYKKDQYVCLRNFKNPCKTWDEFLTIAYNELEYELLQPYKPRKAKIFNEIEGVDYVTEEVF